MASRCLSLRRPVLFVCHLMGGLALSSSMGCGKADTGPRQFDVYGQVTYDGQPLHKGRITFVPDAQRGNSGPPGYALILNGKYDTRSPGGKASVSGPISILITGFSNDPNGGAEPEEPLFDNYPEAVEIAPDQRRSNFDFSVPLQTKSRKPSSRTR